MFLVPLLERSTGQPIAVRHGTVLKGSRRGTTLGFPTANVHAPGLTFSGTHAGVVQIGEQSHRAAVYADPSRELLEAHILDFSQDIYDHAIAITLLEKIAKNEHFIDEDALRRYIGKCVKLVREFFNLRPLPQITSST